MCSGSVVAWAHGGLWSEAAGSASGLLVENARVIVSADPRLALLGFAKAAGFGGLVGLVIGAFMVLDGEPWWSILAAPPLLALLSAATFGTGITLAWWLAPGRVSYAVNGGSLIASRGSRTVKSIPVDRISGVAFDEQITWRSLVFEGWLGYLSPIPALKVTLTPTVDRWDPSNGAVIVLPRILLSGARQAQGLEDLRSAVPGAQD